MRIDIQIIREPIRRPGLAAENADGGTGAWVEFSGIVRNEEEGRAITALEYEAYDSMATRVMREILQDLGGRFPCHSARVIHRTGVVRVGETAIWIGVSAAHRREALELVAAFMDRLKQDVPIWKCRAIAKGKP